MQHKEERFPHAFMTKDGKLRGLGKVIEQLSAARRATDEVRHNGPLTEMTAFGSNPGNLVARTFVPETSRKGAPLVVVLHGCTQNASIYDTGSGWSELAKREGFALLYPEQQKANNSNLCFNWYSPADARREHGEAWSISQMVRQMTQRHGLDESRVFVTGLSAGGAMASVMLAAYPELFAGGAIIAGLPYASANTLPEALERMRGGGMPSRRVLEGRARAAAKHSGRLPTLSVWHGTHDYIVDRSNAEAITDQWRDLHGVGTSTSIVQTVGQHRREVWSNPEGREIIEKYDIKGMGHGTPLATGNNRGCGSVGPHMLEANICSTSRIAGFWGLHEIGASERESSEQRSTNPPPCLAPTHSLVRTPSQVEKVIDDALRAAGLMK